MEYTVVTSPGSNGLNKLIREVNLLIGKGWVVKGGICESTSGDFTYFYQAMIRK